MKILENQNWTIKNEGKDDDITQEIKVDFERYEHIGVQIDISQGKDRIKLSAKMAQDLQAILQSTKFIFNQ